MSEHDNFVKFFIVLIFFVVGMTMSDGFFFLFFCGKSSGGKC